MLTLILEGNLSLRTHLEMNVICMVCDLETPLLGEDLEKHVLLVLTYKIINYYHFNSYLNKNMLQGREVVELISVFQDLDFF